MRYQGRITRWDDSKGFGQIVWHGGGEPIFCHIKAFPRGGPRPAIDDIVTYELGRDERGRPRAENIAYPRRAGQKAPETEGASSRSVAWGAAFTSAFLLGLMAAVLFGKLPGLVLAAYAIASVIAFAAYAMDKAAAQAGRWRTQESTLLTLGLLCGWPGAFLAQRALRHKSSKRSFQSAYWLTVVVNAIGLVLLALPMGADVRATISSW